MLPVETSSSLYGRCCRRKELTKSASLVTRTYCSRIERSLISLSDGLLLSEANNSTAAPSGQVGATSVAHMLDTVQQVVYKRTRRLQAGRTAGGEAADRFASNCFQVVGFDEKEKSSGRGFSR